MHVLKSKINKEKIENIISKLEKNKAKENHNINKSESFLKIDSIKILNDISQQIKQLQNKFVHIQYRLLKHAPRFYLKLAEAHLSSYQDEKISSQNKEAYLLYPQGHNPLDKCSKWFRLRNPIPHANNAPRSCSLDFGRHHGNENH